MSLFFIFQFPCQIEFVQGLFQIPIETFKLSSLKLKTTCEYKGKQLIGCIVILHRTLIPVTTYIRLLPTQPHAYTVCSVQRGVIAKACLYFTQCQDTIQFIYLNMYNNPMLFSGN